MEEGEELTVNVAVRDHEGRWEESVIAVSPSTIDIVRPDNADLRLQKEAGGWELREEGELKWVFDSDGFLLPLTLTSADIVIMDKLREWSKEEVVPLHVWRCAPSLECDALPVAAIAENLGFEKIDAAFTGTNRMDLRVRGLGSVTLWAGAGPFYGGQPVRMRHPDGNTWNRLR